MPEKRSIASIDVRDRRREDLGDIEGLARSIQRYGLINAVTVDDDGLLVTGGRRMAACQSLGWTEIDVKSHGEIGEAERLEIELEENVQRKGLTQAEKDRNMVARAEVAERVLATQVVAGKPEDLLATQLPINPRGRPVGSTEPTSERSVAEYLGVSHTAVQKARAHVEALDKYPRLEEAKKGQQETIQLAAVLDTTPPAQREEMLMELLQRKPKGGKAQDKGKSQASRPSNKAKASTDTGSAFLKYLYDIDDALRAQSTPLVFEMLTQGWPADDRALLRCILDRVVQGIVAIQTAPQEVAS